MLLRNSSIGRAKLPTTLRRPCYEEIGRYTCVVFMAQQAIEKIVKGLKEQREFIILGLFLKICLRFKKLILMLIVS